MFAARFDISAAEAYITKSVAPGAFSYQLDLTFDVYFPSTIPDLGGTFDPNIVEVGSATEASYDSLFPDNSPLPVSWETNTLSNVGSVPVDTWITVEVNMQNTGTNLWAVAWTVGGVSLGTDFAQSFDNDYTVAFPFNLGGRATGFAPGQIFYMRNVQVTDAVSAVLFSDDFSSGDFSNWDAVTGDCVVVDLSVNNVAKFDASVDDAFAIKTLGPATVYVISTSIRLPSPAVMATFSPGNFTADVIQIDPVPDADGLQYNPFTSQGGPDWTSYFHFNPGWGSNIPDEFVPVVITLTNNPPGGTSWDIEWNVNGDVQTDSGVTLTIDNTGMLEFAIGAVFSSNVTDEIYYIGALTVLGDSVLIFSEDWSSGDFTAGGWTVTGDASVVPAPTPAPPPNVNVDRMPLWRWAVTGLDGAIITFLDRLASNRVVQPNLNAPLQMSGTVPSDNPEINVLHTDNLPFLAEGARQLLGFRREFADVVEGDCPTGHGYYVLRAATLILQTTDQSGSGDARTSFSAWDPWQYLFYRPIWIEALGGGSGPDRLIPQAGHTYDPTWTMDQIVIDIFDRMVTNADTDDPTSAIKHSFIDWGWSAFYGDDCTGSEIQTCATSADGWHIEPGTSIGQAIQDICSAGYMDIVLTPIYDPTNRPGVLCEVSIFAQSSDPDSGAGSRNYAAQFAWDAPGRSLVGFDDLIDGTQRANEVQYRNGTAGPLVTLQRDATSIGMYGEYWSEQSFPAQTQAVAVEAIAAEQLVLRKTYKQTLSVNPAPERSPEPFVDYYIGDRVPVFIGKAQRGGYALGDNSPRQALPPGYVGSVPVPDPAVFVWQRVYGIPVQIDDNGVETVSELLVGPIGPPV